MLMLNEAWNRLGENLAKYTWLSRTGRCRHPMAIVIGNSSLFTPNRALLPATSNPHVRYAVVAVTGNKCGAAFMTERSVSNLESIRPAGYDRAVTVTYV